MMRFERKEKLAFRYIDPYKIMGQVDKVAYRFVLPISMNHIHDMFYVSSLCKYISDLSHVLRTNEIQLSKDLSYDKRSIQILDRRIKQLRN